MKVILAKDVANLGKKGELVSISSGYARNFLLPRGLAVEATPQAMTELENRLAAEDRRENETKKEAVAHAKKLEGKTFRFAAKAGESGKLFGSITSKDVAEKVLKDTKIKVDRRKIELPEIKSFGNFEASVKLQTDVTAKIFIAVNEE